MITNYHRPYCNKCPFVGEGKESATIRYLRKPPAVTDTFRSTYFPASTTTDRPIHRRLFYPQISEKITQTFRRRGKRRPRRTAVRRKKCRRGRNAPRSGLRNASVTPVCRMVADGSSGVAAAAAAGGGAAVSSSKQQPTEAWCLSGSSPYTGKQFSK